MINYYKIFMILFVSVVAGALIGSIFGASTHWKQLCSLILFIMLMAVAVLLHAIAF